MANNIEIRINATDYASAVLRHVGQTAVSTAQQIHGINMTQGFAQTNAAIQQTSRSAAGLGGAFRSIAINATSMFSAVAAMEALSAAAKAAMNASMNFTRLMETNQVGIAGILSSMTQINGKNLEWNQAMGISKSIMNQLSTEALKTNATTGELVTTFRGLLGPGLGAGMDVEQIVRLSSVGATAVKSLGLNGTQLVQELRDLVQGGIAPASSTLATSLTLKDSDIKAARNSADGLFNFLIDRLQGFAAAGEASKKTMDGIIDQIKEGTERIGSVGTAPIYGALKSELAEIANSMVYLDKETQEVKLNEQLVNDLKYASTEAVEVGRNLAEIAKPIAATALPVLRLFGDTLVLAGQHAKGLTVAFGAWYAISRLMPIYKNITAAVHGNAEAHGVLAAAILRTRAAGNAQATAQRVQAQNAMADALRAGAAERALLNQRLSAQRGAARLAESDRRRQAIVTQGVLKLEEREYGLLAGQLRGLQREYMALGASARQAGNMQAQAARAARTGNVILTQSIIARQRTNLVNAQTAQAAVVAATTGFGAIISKLKGLGVALMSLVGGPIGLTIVGLYALTEAIDYVKNKNKVEGYNPNAEVYKIDGKHYKKAEVEVPVPNIDYRTGLADPNNPRMEKQMRLIRLNEQEQKEQDKKDNPEIAAAQDKAKEDADALKLKFDKESAEQAKLTKDLEKSLFGLLHEGVYSTAADKMAMAMNELDLKQKEAEKIIGAGTLKEQLANVEKRKQKNIASGMSDAEAEEAAKKDEQQVKEQYAKRDKIRNQFAAIRTETMRVENDRVRKLTEDAYDGIYEITHSTLAKQLHDIKKKKEENIRSGMAEVDATRIAETEKKNIINQAREELIGMSIKANPEINEYQKQYYDLMTEKLNMEQKFGRESAEIARLYEKKKTQLAVDETKRRIDAVRGLASGAFGGVTGKAKQLETEWKEKQKENKGSYGIGIPDFLGQALEAQKQEQKQEAALLNQLLKRTNISPTDQDLDKKIELAGRNPYVDDMFNKRSSQLVYGQESFDMGNMTMGIDRVVEAIKAQRDALKAEVTVRVTFDEDGNARLKNAIAGDIANLITLGGA